MKVRGTNNVKLEEQREDGEWVEYRKEILKCVKSVCSVIDDRVIGEDGE